MKTKHKISDNLRQRLEERANGTIWLTLEPAYPPTRNEEKPQKITVPVGRSWQEVVNNAEQWIHWQPLTNEQHDSPRIREFWYEYKLDGTVNKQVNDPDQPNGDIGTQLRLHNIRRRELADSALTRFEGILEEARRQYEEVQRLAQPIVRVDK